MIRTDNSTEREFLLHRRRTMAGITIPK
jgi:hypothetical protein